jgi:cell pole-organizing protein PopZ
MAEPAKETDQSMEDILQSIKRIIADEGEAPPSAGSDVLELTDLLAEDAAPPVVESADAPAAAAPEAPLSLDDIVGAPEVAAEPAPSPAPEPAPEPAPSPAPVAAAPAPEPVPAPPAELRSVSPQTVVTGGLLAEETVSASAAALSALSQLSPPVAPTIASPAFRSGVTVEDLVLEALRPMLKDWLDKNLPSLVGGLVEKEIRRLSGR